jgi:phosphoenolpyruvate carboxykinase (GTP)
MGDKLGKKAPKIFYTNWFRKSKEGKWLWPGFGDNVRVLKWMCERIDGKVGARETAVGLLPNEKDLDLSGLNIPAAELADLLRIDADGWKAEIPEIEQYLATAEPRLPARMKAQVAEIRKRLGN